MMSNPLPNYPFAAYEVKNESLWFQWILPAVFSAIVKGQTCSVVNTGGFIIHTLQCCKRQESS